MTTPNDRLLNILLVEDDEVDVMNVQRAFQKGHITNPLFIASNGVEALEQLRNGKVPRDRRIILLDLNMPQMNGIEFLRELRRDPELRLTPVVVLTVRSNRPESLDGNSDFTSVTVCVGGGPGFPFSWTLSSSSSCAVAALAGVESRST